MKVKADCEKCHRIHQACKLRRSQVDHRRLCYICYKSEFTQIEMDKLKLMDRDNYFLYKSQKKEKKRGRVWNLLKNGISLIRGEDKVLEDSDDK